VIAHRVGREHDTRDVQPIRAREPEGSSRDADLKPAGDKNHPWPIIVVEVVEVSKLAKRVERRTRRSIGQILRMSLHAVLAVKGDHAIDVDRRYVRRVPQRLKVLA
jgi:hypothetical protein